MSRMANTWYQLPVAFASHSTQPSHPQYHTIPIPYHSQKNLEVELNTAGNVIKSNHEHENDIPSYPFSSCAATAIPHDQVKSAPPPRSRHRRRRRNSSYAAGVRGKKMGFGSNYPYSSAMLCSPLTLPAHFHFPDFLLSHNASRC